MHFPELDNHPYIKELTALNKKHVDRMDFHRAVEPLLVKMGTDMDFLKIVVRRNFEDPGYLKFQYSEYNIAFMYLHETADYNLKIHMFPPHPEKKDGIAAHCIHHHNNYTLTTYAMHGSGYETFLFEKQYPVDDTTLEAKLKIRKHFYQKDWNPSRVESWEPHVVFIPEALSSTMLIWTPDKVRATDALRQNPIIKPFKKVLSKTINALGMAGKFGISQEGKKYQFYVKDGQYFGIEEDEYFAPTRAANGPEVSKYSMQLVFAVIQRMGIYEKDYLEALKKKSTTPAMYIPFIDMILNDEPIPDLAHRTEINIPNKAYTREDILEADKNSTLVVNA